MMKGREPKMMALALASEDIALILSFICLRRRRMSVRFSSVFRQITAGFALDGQADDEELEVLDIHPLGGIPQRVLKWLTQLDLVRHHVEFVPDGAIELLADIADRFRDGQARLETPDDKVERFGKFAQEPVDPAA